MNTYDSGRRLGLWRVSHCFDACYKHISPHFDPVTPDIQHQLSMAMGTAPVAAVGSVRIFCIERSVFIS
jgi:hypothetical protein